MKKILILITTIFLSIQTGFSAEMENFEEELMSDEESELAEEISGKVYMQGVALDDDLLKISVLIADMQQPVLGAAFNLKYENDKVNFLKYVPGEFLERGGDPFYMVKNDTSKSEIVFGETLKKEDNFPLGEGEIVDFYFQVLKDSELNFEFSNGTISTLDEVRQDLEKIIWENFSTGNGGQRIEVEGLNENVKLNSTNWDFQGKWSVLILVISSILVAMFLIIWIKKNQQNMRRASKT